MLGKIWNTITDKLSDGAMPDIGPILSDKPRILYIVTKYPEFSETYIHEEMVAMTEDYEIKIIDYEKSGAPGK